MDDLSRYYRTEDDVAIFSKMRRMAILIHKMAVKITVLYRRIEKLQEELADARRSDSENG